MKEIVQHILDLYFKKMRDPTFEELVIENRKLLDEKGCCFVTLYINGEVRGSAGNIKDMKDSLAQEIYSNTLEALVGDKRFPPITLDEAQNIKYRCDKISERKMISEAEMKLLDPLNFGVIVIKRDYEKVAIILPNMSSKLLIGEDFIPVLLKKLGEKKWSEKDYIIYEISTEVESNY